MSEKSALAPLYLLLLLMTCLPSAARAEPMLLNDSTPRWVLVRFEDSSSNHPDLLDRTYTAPFLAWLEPGPEPDQIVVRVGSEVLERDLFRGRRPLPGSFSDYVWVFDRNTGAVLSASFSGVFLHEIDWGFVTTDIQARVSSELTTTRVGGFEPPSNVWGRQLRSYCADAANERCTLVTPRRYDPSSGYVNAVGSLRIDSTFTSFSTFSALGEARFSELSRAAPAAEAWAARSPDETIGAATVSAIDVAAPPRN